MSYYKIINGKRYERSLLESAEKFQADNPDKKITLSDVQALFQAAQDRRRVTPTEERTLTYIFDHFPFTQEAKEWFENQPLTESEFERELIQTVRARLDLSQLTWNIEQLEVQAQEREFGSSEPFEEVLYRGIDTLLHDQTRGVLRLAHLVDFRFLDKKGPEWIPAAVRSFVNRGKISLIPRDRKGVEHFFELPLGTWEEDMEEKYWIFGLELPDLPLFRFLSFVPREAGNAYTQIYFSKQSPAEARVSFVLGKMLGWDRYSWRILGEEANRQELTYPQNKQSWELALYASLDQGIYNRESSLSFYDHLTEEIWPDPKRTARSYIDQYLRNGFRVFLISEEDTSSSGVPSFPLPPNFSLDLDSFWYFGVDFPGQTDIRVLINKARAGRGIDDSWNDAFIPKGAPTGDRIKEILLKDFKLEALQWDIDPGELALQHDTYDPWWRNIPSVIRQMVNTYLYDYLTEQSLFYVVSQVHREDIQEASFESPQAYQQAISLQIHRYLKKGRLFLIPSRIYQLSEDELGDMTPPPNGEALDDYWIFQLFLPDLGDQAFYACIPRWPSFEEAGGRPYNYST